MQKTLLPLFYFKSTFEHLRISVDKHQKRNQKLHRILKGVIVTWRRPVLHGEALNKVLK